LEKGGDKIIARSGMQAHKINILSTRPVDGSLVSAAAAAGIQLDIIPFIDTEPVQTVEVQQEIEIAAVELATVVFTSMNAVESVTEMLDGCSRMGDLLHGP
jgi:uroporphyrinogen-III synthase